MQFLVWANLLKGEAMRYIISMYDDFLWSDELTDDVVQACIDGDTVTAILRVANGVTEQFDYNSSSVEEHLWIPVRKWESLDEVI